MNTKSKTIDLNNKPENITVLCEATITLNHVSGFEVEPKEATLLIEQMLGDGSHKDHKNIVRVLDVRGNPKLMMQHPFTRRLVGVHKVLHVFVSKNLFVGRGPLEIDELSPIPGS